MAEQGRSGGQAANKGVLGRGELPDGLRQDAAEGTESEPTVQAGLQLVPGSTALAHSAAAQRRGNDAASAEAASAARRVDKSAKRRRSRMATSTARSAALRRELSTMPPVRGALAEAEPGPVEHPERPSNFAQAYALTAGERQSLAPRAVRRPNAKIPNVVSLALRAVQFLDAHREAIVRVSVNQRLIDRLDTYARALSHAHALLVSATDVWVPSPYEDAALTDLGSDTSPRVITRAQRLQHLSKRATQARQRLRADVTNLIVQGSLPPTSLAALSRKVGYQNTAKDILALAHLVFGVDPGAEAQSTLSVTTLDEFTAIAHELFAYAARRGKPGAPSEQRAKALDDQARAFTLLWLAYREAQRAVANLLWDKGDYRDVLPSLMAGVGRKRGG